jgi:hypothetical protein
MNASPTRLVRAAFAWIVLAAAGLMPAQPPVPAPLGPDRVTFFTEPNFRGDALTVEAGASVTNLERMLRPNQQPWAFAISSVRVEGAARATVYSGTGLSGDRLEISGSIADLYAQPRGAARTWDRAIASVAVVGPARPVVTQPAPPVRYETAPPPTTVYVTPPPPPPVVVHRPRMDPRTAEIIVQRAYREVLGRPADPDGLRTYRDRLMRDGWTEQQVVQQLQRSGEARAVNADEAITKAYREVLGRDPDPKGLAHYRAKWRGGWTQGQIRDDLRRSAEGREGHIRNAITRAYRELLGREPDASGYAHFERAMRERGWSEREVRQNIMQGDEYRQRHGKK